MEFPLIFHLQIVYLIEITKTQYHGEYYHGDQPYYVSDDDDYSHIDYRSKRYKKHGIGKGGSGGGRLPLSDDEYSDYSSDSEEQCKCKCSQCDMPKLCCQQECMTCMNQQPQPNPQYQPPPNPQYQPPPNPQYQPPPNPQYQPQPQYPQPQSQANLLFVPYPYPLVVTGLLPPNDTLQTTTTPATTTKCVPETTKAEPKVEEKVVNKKKLRSASSETFPEFKDMIVKTPPSKNGESKYILTSLRRMKTNWLPKFGIVPIPDQLAESLMSQMRSMKGINSIRRI